MKIKRTNKLLLTFLAIFILSAGFLLFKVPQRANAESAECQCTRITSSGKSEINSIGNTADKASCEQACKAKGNDWKIFSFNPDAKAAEALSRGGGPPPGTCDGVDFDWGWGVFICALLNILDLVGILLNFAIALFSSVADADKVTAVLSNSAIEETWGIVRDLCNIGFILILLVSAFSTVFQVSSYNYKKILMWLVIMALLVNFSFPITRFVIDISNSLMYTILDMALTNTNLASPQEDGVTLIPMKSLQTILYPGPKAEASTLIMSIIFVFILALTVIALAFILLIRTIALAILIIFSPVGFVGSILGKGGEWWNNLSKYAMAGPIIALVLLIAIKLMAATSELALVDAAAGVDSGLITAIAKFTIPIVILWMGMAMAVKGIDGAGAILGKAQGIAKGAGKKFSGFNWANQQYKDYKKQRDERSEKARWKTGKWAGDKANDIQDTLLSPISSDAEKRLRGRKEEKNRKDMEDKSKEADDTKTTADVASNVNSVFHATGPNAGSINTAVKLTSTHAGDARSFTRKNNDEKKEFVLDEIGGKTTIPATSKLSNTLAGITPMATGGTRTEEALFKILNGTHDEGDLRTISAYVNKQSENVMKAYVKG